MIIRSPVEPNSSGIVFCVSIKVMCIRDDKKMRVDVLPDDIMVNPLSEIALDYFLPKNVQADNLFTGEEKLSKPFMRCVKIKNMGYVLFLKAPLNLHNPKSLKANKGCTE